MKRLVLFDLDDTLLAGDSDFQWAQMLIEAGVLDRRTYEALNLEFYEKYKAGVLDVSEFLEFQLRPLAQHSRAQLEAWHAQFMTSKVLPMVRPGARPLIAHHGDALTAIITATNRFVTGPIAPALGVPNLLATELEEVDGRFTGREKGTPCYREGKVTRLEQWLASRGERLSEYDESWFYTDSINDLPLLSTVTHPVVAHPDDRLRAHAEAHGWPIVSLD
jgi:HAD superfamily hydrolase (TIGR01490 family)